LGLGSGLGLVLGGLVRPCGGAEDRRVPHHAPRLAHAALHDGAAHANARVVARQAHAQPDAPREDHLDKVRVDLGVGFGFGFG